MSEPLEQNTLLEAFNKSLKQLEKSNVANIKKRATETLTATKNLLEKQNEINHATHQLLVTGFDHRAELQEQINVLNELIPRRAN